jgi:Protein of unknown function (DUF2723)
MPTHEVISKIASPGNKPAPAKIKSPKTSPGKSTAPDSTAAPEPEPKPKPSAAPFFRRSDWAAFAITTIVAFIGYFLTVAPEVTLEDSGELATGSFYAGVPHPPGYPLWTVLTWLFTVLFPVGNVAYRVAVASAIAGALAAGLLAMITSRASRMIIAGLEELSALPLRVEMWICLVAGCIAGLLLAFNGYMWGQAVIVEVYPLSVLSFMAVMCCMLRWLYSPDQTRYLYLAWFLFGVCFLNHQTLILAATGLEICILAADRRLGRDFLLLNSLCYLLGVFALSTKSLGTLTPSDLVKCIFHMVGMGSLIGCAALSLWEYRATKQTSQDFTAQIVVPASTLILAALAGATYFYLHMRGLAGLLVVCVAATWVHSWRRHNSGILPAFGMLMMWVAGAAFYLYMPLTSMSNPPMNWGYPRTVEGFVHAFTRGQYGKIDPTNFVDKPHRLFVQIGMYLHGANEQFNPICLALALVPFLFFLRFRKRERAWLVGLTAIWGCLAILLMVLLNPIGDKQSVDQTKVFFTASHTMICMLIGHGLSLIVAFMLTRYEKFRVWGMAGGGIAVALAMWSLITTIQDVYGEKSGMGIFQFAGYALHKLFAPNEYALPIAAGLILLVLAVFFILSLAISKGKPPSVAMLAIFGLLPTHSILSHWSENEQRDHWFGYWFGHDMFKPPFVGPDGMFSYDAKLREAAMKGPDASMVYPEMPRNAVLFGGTDPGRFCPTYMIFCDSFVPPKKLPEQDQQFDRRDVYIITQNALADGTYLEYIRAQYDRSTQPDPPFFQELLRSEKEKQQNYKTNLLARIANQTLDQPFLNLGAKIEARRRAEGIFPPVEIYTPSPDDSQQCFNEYMGDVQIRLNHDMRLQHDLQRPNEPRQLRPGEDPNHEIKPGEDVQLVGDRIQVVGQTAVMSINGLLTKVIFDHNPTNEFFVEESFPLDWMYPYLTPFGIIMKINRQPLAELTDDTIKRDHEFWSQYSQRLIGNWITYDTSVKEIADFVDKVYLERDFDSFKGDRKFVRDDDAQKAFSKLRSSIAGLYTWRIANAKSATEQQKMIKEADFAFRQAFAFCPYSPEAVFRYAQLLANLNRLDDAIIVAETSLKLDPNNDSSRILLQQLQSIRLEHSRRSSG